MSRAQPFESPCDRGLAAWIQLAALLSLAALATPFFLGRVYVADDLGEFHLPLRNFYAEQITRGEPFNWMNSLYGGFYVTAEGQLGGFHPLHLLLYRWLPLGAAFDLELLASYPFMLAGMYLFLKRALHQGPSALFGSLAFTLCGFNLLHFIHPNAVAVVAHIPWLLFAIDVALDCSRRETRALAGLAIGLLTASQWLLGYPQYVWFSLLAEIAYAIWRGNSASAGWRIHGGLILAKMLGTVVGAVQLLPTLDALSDSVRRTADTTFANTGSMHPLNLVQLLAPYLFRNRVVGQNTHELGLYAGAVPCLLVVWLLFNRKHWGQFAGLIRATLAFGGFAFLMACGEFGGVYRLQTLIPVLDRFRFPCRAIVLVQLSVAVAAGAAFAILGSRNGSREDRSHRPLTVAVLVSFALAAVGPLIWPDEVASMALIACGPLLVGVAAILVGLAERNSRGALAAIAVFTAIDLCCYGLSYSVYPRTAELHDYVRGVAMPPSGLDGLIAAPDNAAGLRTGDRMLLAGLRRVDGYAGLEPAKRLDYRTASALRLAGASWVFHAAAKMQQPDERWTAVEPRAPRARMVAKTYSSEQLGCLADLPLDAAAVDQPLDLSQAAEGDVLVVTDLPGRMRLKTRADATQLLVTTESFHSGWKAIVDGRPLPAMRVNGDFLGCLVPKGRHCVELRFLPDSLRIGAAVSAWGLGLMLCTFLFQCHKRRGIGNELPDGPGGSAGAQAKQGGG